jgi:cytochrome P450
LEQFRYGPHGIVSSSGPEWVEQRRFSLRHLRDFGFGKSAGEDIIMNEVHELLSMLTKQAGQPCKLDRVFHVAVLNTLWMITTGNRYQHDDPRLWSVFNHFEKILVKVGKNPTAIFFPTLAKLFPNFSGWDLLLKMREEMTSIVQGHVEQHKETFPEDGVPRDFMDAYLAEISGTTDANSSFHKSVAARSLMATMIDFFVAGSDTVSQTVLWGILYLCKYPEVQKKLQDELDSVVGRNRHPALSDRSSLPYFEATFAEIMRFSSLVPTSLNHSTERDCKILGFDCPKGTVIIANVYAIHYNEEYFPEPYQFKPERFLSEDGKTFKKPEAVLGFGIGKRVCLGETLARDELFLYFTNVFHRFNVKLADESRDVSMEGISKVFRHPHEYKVVLTVRD